MIKYNFNKTKAFNLKAEIMSFLKAGKNVSDVETQLQPITEPKEEWDRGFVVGEVEADKECE